MASVKIQVFWVPRAETLGYKYSLLRICPPEIRGGGNRDKECALTLERIKGLIKLGHPMRLLLVQGVDVKTLWQEVPAPCIPPVALSFPPSAPSSWVCWASQVELVVKNLPANAGDVRDVSLIPGLGRSLGGWHNNPLQYSCLENPMDRGAWSATGHKMAESTMPEMT